MIELMGHNLINLSVWLYIVISFLGIGLCFYMNSFIRVNDYSVKNKVITASALIMHFVISILLLILAKSESGLFGYTFSHNLYNEYIAYAMLFIIAFSIKSIDEGSWKSRLKHVLDAIPLLLVLSLGILTMILISDYIRGVDNEILNSIFPYKSVMEDLPN